jgi:hypothetical protein
VSKAILSCTGPRCWASCWRGIICGA